MPPNAATIPVDAIAAGHHVCGVSDSDAVQQELLAEFVAAGIAHGERVACFPDAVGPDDVLDDLASAGVPVGEAIAAGDLVVIPARESYLSELPFDPERMIASVRALIDDALAAGYRGMRVAGDMSWGARDIDGAERLEEYEAAVGSVFADRPAAALCQYDSRSFDAARLGTLRDLHDHRARVPAVSDDGVLRVHRLAGASPDDVWLKLAGEADLASSAALETALDELAREAGAVHLDLGRLRFMDLSGLRPLTRLAREHRVVLHHPGPGVRRLVQVLDGYVSGVEVVP